MTTQNADKVFIDVIPRFINKPPQSPSQPPSNIDKSTNIDKSNNIDDDELLNKPLPTSQKINIFELFDKYKIQILVILIIILLILLIYYIYQWFNKINNSKVKDEKEPEKEKLITEPKKEVDDNEIKNIHQYIINDEYSDNDSVNECVNDNVNDNVNECVNEHIHSISHPIPHQISSIGRSFVSPLSVSYISVSNLSEIPEIAMFNNIHSPIDIDNINKENDYLTKAELLLSKKTISTIVFSIISKFSSSLINLT